LKWQIEIFQAAKIVNVNAMYHREIIPRSSVDSLLTADLRSAAFKSCGLAEGEQAKGRLRIRLRIGPARQSLLRGAFTARP
jgi:hypothetical protein